MGEPKERPILFSAPMVRALLSGEKTQTRRIVKPPRKLADDDGNHFDMDRHSHELIHWLNDKAERVPMPCPYGAPGDLLWVRETFCPAHAEETAESGRRFFYAASDDGVVFWDDRLTEGGQERSPWKPSIHMPRWASRIDLEVTGVRVERLQAITEADAKAEGATGRIFPGPYGERHGWSLDWSRVGDLSLWASSSCESGRREKSPLTEGDICLGSPQMAYASLWNEINGAGSWDANPYVWVVEFKRVRP